MTSLLVTRCSGFLVSSAGLVFSGWGAPPSLVRFIQTTAKDSGTVDFKYLRDIILNIVIAGKDTTAGALSWFFYMACKHPEIQEKICQEVTEATNAGATASMDQFVQSLTDEALNKMHYLHAALTETLRLYPSVPIENKQCFSDDVLPNGFSVSKGDIVFYPPYAMGRMEYLWGKDAGIFQPERWLDENGEFQPESPFKFTAFQAGPRICFGEGLRVQADEDLRGRAPPFLRVPPARREGERQLPHHDDALHRRGSPPDGDGEVSVPPGQVAGW